MKNIIKVFAFIITFLLLLIALVFRVPGMLLVYVSQLITAPRKAKTTIKTIFDVTR